MPNGLIKKVAEKITKKPTTIKKENKSEVSNLRKLKLLITVVDRSKTMFYEDLLEGFEINVQMVLYGHGTASSQMLALLGAVERDKAVIISFIREDMVKEVLEVLTEKFKKVKNGKGIAYTIPLDSMIGVAMYQLLSNDTTIKEGGKK